MDSINDKNEGKKEKDKSGDGQLNSVLFTAAYSDKNPNPLNPKDAKVQQISSKILPNVTLNFDDPGAADITKAVSAPNMQDLLGKKAQIPTERKGSDPRAQANGSPGWNDFSAKTPESKDTSILGSVKDFLKPDYAPGDNRGSSAGKTKDAINDAAPGRQLSQDSGGGTDKISPPVPIGIVFDLVSGSGAEIIGRQQGKQQADDNAVKQRQEQEARDRDRKAKEDAAKEQEKRDQEQKDRERKAEEQRERDQKEKDSQQKESEQKQKDEDKKKKEGTPNPDSDRPQLSQAELDAAKGDIRNRIGGGLTNPLKPGEANKHANAPSFGKIRDKGWTTNPTPNNDGNTSDRPNGAVERPLPKIDVRGGGKI
ncbi:MAG: DUF1682 domain-containing protein [Candidatus Obscuribacterales bacterium]|jgi:hypothetical protein|nr:DUF1682 domain-containing protein [Candidatus Obscuribacterales bacterium]